MPPDPVEPVTLWNDFLVLGETLVKQPDSLSLSRYFSAYLQENLACQAELWLVEPFYPLPGEPPVKTLPTDDAPAIVGKCLKSKKSSLTKDHSEAALPVLSQNNLIGIVHVTRAADNPFSRSEIATIERLVAVAALAMQVNRQSVLKNWRYDQISLVRSVTSQITNVLDLDELCLRVTNLIQCTFDYYHVGIYTVDETNKSLQFRASSLKCQPNQKNPLLELDYTKGLVHSAAQTGNEFIVKDVTKEPLYVKIDLLPDTRAEAVLPLKVENRILGVLDVQSDQLGAFHENDMLVLRSLADSIALAVETARLFKSLEYNNARVTAVAEIGSAISSILDLDELLKKVVTVISERFSLPHVHIFTNHSNRRKVIFEAGTGPQSQKLKPNSYAFDLDDEIGIIPYVARTGKPLLANDISKEPLYRPTKYFPQKIKSELTVPLRFSDDVLGVLDMQSDQVNRFTSEDLELFETLASGIAQSLRNASLYRSEKWRRRVADSFRDMAGLLNANLALPEMLDRVLAALETNLPCDAAAIWLLDDDVSIPIEERLLHLAAVRGISKMKVLESIQGSIKVRNFLNLGISNEGYTIRGPEDPYGPLGAARKFKPNYSSLAVPLRSGDEILGVLTLAHRKEGRYGSEAGSIATTLAGYAAVAIQNARLYTTAQEEAWSSTVLLQVAEAMQSINTIDSLLSTMVRLTPLLVGVEYCAIYMLREDGETYDLKQYYGFQPTFNEQVAVDTEAIAFFKLNATRSPVFIKDPKSELGLKSLPFSDKSSTLVLLPLIAHGRLSGAFLIAHTSKADLGKTNRFSDQTLAILQGIAQQTAVGLENISLLENRQEEAYITAVLLQVAQAVVSQNQLDDVLDTIVQLMPILVGVDSCVIYLWDKINQQYIPAKAVAPTHAEQEEILGHAHSFGTFKLLDQVIETDQMAGCQFDAPDFPSRSWRGLTCVENQDLKPGNNSHWLLAFPLSIKGEKYGIMLTRETNVQESYHQKRIELIKGVAQQTALAIQNERLKEEMVDRERVEREFQLARQIQKTFLPQSIPGIDGWDFDLRWRTAREVGGDFYDVFITRDERIAFAIADVSDKGMPAALYMTVTRTLIRAMAQYITSPSEVLDRVNELLYEESQNGMFVTAIYALLDPQSGVLEYANAGHNLPLLYRSETSQIEKLAKGGIALGVVDSEKYVCHKLEIKEKDTLLLYTDGVTEAFSATGDQFTESRLINALQSNLYGSASEMLESLEDLINLFRKGEPPSDDLTMLAIHRILNPKK
jgi:sigma-B regulation protein RsbU (phosphoserine phosphatase)